MLLLRPNGPLARLLVRRPRLRIVLPVILVAVALVRLSLGHDRWFVQLVMAAVWATTATIVLRRATAVDPAVAPLG